MVRPWVVVAALALVQVGLAWRAQTRPAGVTYVFTPLVDVVPGGLPLDAAEASELKAEAKNAVDARDIQKAFARLGSNLSLVDLLRGVETLDDLTPDQRRRIGDVLTAAKRDHDAVVAVQREILDLERQLDGQVQGVMAALTPEQQAAVRAKAPR